MDTGNDKLGFFSLEDSFIAIITLTPPETWLKDGLLTMWARFS